MSDTAGRVVVITGAGKGLGRAFAHHLAERGARLVINNRWTDRTTPSSADLVVADIRAAGGTAVANHDEAQHPESGQRMIAQAIECFGRIDAVIANAGVPEAMPFRKHSQASFREIFDINFFGALNLVHAAWPLMTAQSYGRVILNASSAGLHSNAGMAAYSSSKAALIGLGRALALEGEKRNVLVNMLAPYAATTMTAPGLGKDEASHMAPELAAPLVSWLASPACDVTGQSFVVGMGKIASARCVESPVWRLESDVAASVRATLDLSESRTFPNAVAAFNGFMRETPRVLP